MFVNKMFYLVLALFLLSWAIALTLAFFPSLKEAAAMTGLFVVVYILALNGILGPSSIGALLVLSGLVALHIRLRKKK
jgi:hypothetical protein